MINYNSKQEWINANSGEVKLLGFQQVLTNDDKVHVWIRDQVAYPASQNRHKTTRSMNQSDRIHNWGKSVWLKSKLWKHLEHQLSELDIIYQDLLDLTDPAKCDKWETKNDGLRNFLKAEIINPYSEITRTPMHIQITQYAGEVPQSIYTRASAENLKGLGEYTNLFDKYENAARIRTYTPVYIKCRDGSVSVEKALIPVLCSINGDLVYAYEESEIVFGEPHNIWVEYRLDTNVPLTKVKPNEEVIQEGVHIDSKLTFNIT